MCHTHLGPVNPPIGIPVPVIPAPLAVSRAGRALPALSCCWHPRSNGTWQLPSMVLRDKHCTGVTPATPTVVLPLCGLLGGKATVAGTRHRPEQVLQVPSALWACQAGECSPSHNPPFSGSCQGPLVPEESSATAWLETQIYCDIGLQTVLNQPSGDSRSAQTT